MATKRRQALMAATRQRVGEVERSLDTPIEKGAGEFLRLPLDEIRPDPENPRWGGKKGLTLPEVHSPESAKTDTRRRDAEDVRALARTIESTGLHHPIEVWRNGGWYQILDGERRYLALCFLGRTHTDAKLLPEPPKRTRLSQLVVNVQRSNLTMPQMLHNLELILKEAEQAGTPINDAKTFDSYVNLTRTQAFRWWSILEGPRDVREAIHRGVLNRLTAAYDAAREPNIDKRRQLYADGEAQVSSPAAAEAQKSTKKRRSRKNKRISLGSTTSASVVKYIMESIDPGSVEGIDWNNDTAAQRSFKKLLRNLERDLSDGKRE